MYKLTKLVIRYSENNIVNSIDFTTMDVKEAISKLQLLDLSVYNDKQCVGNGYDKIGITLVWEDGFEFDLRYDLGDGISIRDRLDFSRILKRFEGKNDSISLSIKADYERFVVAFKDREIY